MYVDVRSCWIVYVQFYTVAELPVNCKQRWRFGLKATAISQNMSEWSALPMCRGRMSAFSLMSFCFFQDGGQKCVPSDEFECEEVSKPNYTSVPWQQLQRKTSKRIVSGEKTVHIVLLSLSAYLSLFLSLTRKIKIFMLLFSLQLFETD